MTALLPHVQAGDGAAEIRRWISEVPWFVLADYNTFNNQFFNTIVEAINDGTITTKDISTFLFPNTYLYIGTLSVCCVLGYHTYVFNDLPNGVEQRWVLNYSSWISPGLFFGGLC